jgi:hypothetical protein
MSLKNLPRFWRPQNRWRTYYLIKRYRQIFGRWPRIIYPKTFNEKILVKLLTDRNPERTIYADKLLVRDLIKVRLGTDKYLTRVYAVVDKAGKIRGINLPKKYVMKPNHGSGWIRIIHDSRTIDLAELIRDAENWLSRNYGLEWFEWPYENITPYVIFEELLEIHGRIPVDYKFFCFNGEPRFIQVDTDRFSGHKRNLYDCDFNLLPVKIGYENHIDQVNKPRTLDEMLSVARQLAHGLDFIRVDLYSLEDRVVFGELTNYPGRGEERFEPASWDLEFGSHWIFD